MESNSNKFWSLEIENARFRAELPGVIDWTEIYKYIVLINQKIFMTNKIKL